MDTDVTSNQFNHLGPCGLLARLSSFASNRSHCKALEMPQRFYEAFICRAVGCCTSFTYAYMELLYDPVTTQPSEPGFQALRPFTFHRRLCLAHS
jgi:hypothetical protein